ncbi:uncharacterized protein ACLA_072070 [Aspergillus clavatus NRRL 1]|uniref:Uncharacterized protein n=1 Tax=Aspergillus clavatus (strain ATCC 1007 / CBS 513.65 / DSM 816 / NCTC 3887 / NRRL 1 / QM 1276 / 107) TaxID=344612 RepID=A1C703_ASPCL|nr:uncharacterized protein ACLA_072070 [Aspergillus clavatus NRRL 1]EAW14174.1 conserved hypothetical protein [Aspergillus clavatus NRRL 1]
MSASGVELDTDSMSPSLPIFQCSTLIDPPSSPVKNPHLLTPVQRYSAALDALNGSNKNLEYKIAKLHSGTLLLKLDLMKLQRHMTCFHHDLLATWEADILTRLIEVIHERQGRNLPGGHALGDHKMLDRGELSEIYTAAAGHVGKRTLKRLFGLSENYWLALQKYGEIADLRSTTPPRTAGTFARWLLSSENERNPGRAAFWLRLFPVCYGRTAEECASVV